MTQLSSGVTHEGGLRTGGEKWKEVQNGKVIARSDSIMAHHSMPDNRYQNGKKLKKTSLLLERSEHKTVHT